MQVKTTIHSEVSADGVVHQEIEVIFQSKKSESQAAQTRYQRALVEDLRQYFGDIAVRNLRLNLQDAPIALGELTLFDGLAASAKGEADEGAADGTDPKGAA